MKEQKELRCRVKDFRQLVVEVSAQQCNYNLFMPKWHHLDHVSVSLANSERPPVLLMFQVEQSIVNARKSFQRHEAIMVALICLFGYRGTINATEPEEICIEECME